MANHPSALIPLSWGGGGGGWGWGVHPLLCKLIMSLHMKISILASLYTAWSSFCRSSKLLGGSKLQNLLKLCDPNNDVLLIISFDLASVQRNICFKRFSIKLLMLGTSPISFQVFLTFFRVSDQKEFLTFRKINTERFEILLIQVVYFP